MNYSYYIQPLLNNMYQYIMLLKLIMRPREAYFIPDIKYDYRRFILLYKCNIVKQHLSVIYNDHCNVYNL